MKVVAKTWLKSPRAMLWVFINLLVDAMRVYATTRITIVIPEVIQTLDLSRIKEVVFLLAMECIATSISPAIISKGHRRFYSDTLDRYAQKVLGADYELYTKHTTTFLTDVQEFVNSAANAGKTVLYIVMNVITLAASLIAFYAIVGNISLFSIVIYLIATVITIPCYKIHRKLNKKARDEMRARNQVFENSIVGFQEVRLFCTQKKISSDIHNRNEAIYACGDTRSMVNAVITLLISLSENLVRIAIVIIAIHWIIDGKLTVAAGVAIVTLSGRVLGSVVNIVDLVDEITDMTVRSDDFEAVMKYQNRPEDPNPITINSFQDKIEIRHIGFSYENTSQVINDLSMEIKAGQKIGICGKSGDGKTTLLKLITKFYHPQSGQILVDGVDLEKINTNSFYKRIGVVSQDATIFPGSILENIQYGRDHVNIVDVIDAAKKANLYEFIRSLSEGFDTEVGPRGIKLSGGQRQRIALARMFLSNADIVILDEATSALDNETEHLVQDAIEQMDRQTVIIVAHRLTTIQHCDQIFVMDHGTIAEQGTHEELMNTGGLYYKMATSVKR